jgi:hypothetical protein
MIDDVRLLATEREWQAAVEGWLDGHRWLRFHDTDPRRNRAGFPDLVATNGRVLLLAELKAMGGRIRPEQRAWDDALAGVTRLVSGIWRPDTADELYDLIRGAR